MVEHGLKYHVLKVFEVRVRLVYRASSRALASAAAFRLSAHLNKTSLHRWPLGNVYSLIGQDSVASIINQPLMTFLDVNNHLVSCLQIISSALNFQQITYLFMRVPKFTVEFYGEIFF